MELKILFGGTFDPIHKGHLYIAKQAILHTNAESLTFLPSNLVPVHKKIANVSNIQRLDMLELALKSEKDYKLFISRQEILQSKGQYTIDTLKEIRQEIGWETSMAFLMGEDSWNNITTWKEWKMLPFYTHLIIAKRYDENQKINNNTPIEFKKKIIKTPQKLQILNAGFIYFMTIKPCSISSSLIRDKINKKEEINQFLTPSVSEYIKQNKLYQNK